MVFGKGELNIAKRPEVRKKISDAKKLNNTMSTPEGRKKVSDALKAKYATGYKNKNTGRHPSEKARKNMSIGQRRRMKNNPEEWKATCRKSGLTAHQRHPGLASRMGKTTQMRHPNQSREVAKRTQREWRERDPEDYYAKKRSYAKLMLEAREKVKREDPIAYKEMYKNAGRDAFQSILDNSPFYWDDVPFLSNLEREVARCILTRPIKGVNCNVHIGRKAIDFYPCWEDKMYQGCLVEYHPYDRDLTKEEYYKLRREIIDNSKYKDLELVVITNIKEVKNGNKESS